MCNLRCRRTRKLMGPVPASLDAPGAAPPLLAGRPSTELFRTGFRRRCRSESLRAKLPSAAIALPPPFRKAAGSPEAISSYARMGTAAGGMQGVATAASLQAVQRTYV